MRIRAIVTTLTFSLLAACGGGDSGLVIGGGGSTPPTPTDAAAPAGVYLGSVGSRQYLAVNLLLSAPNYSFFWIYTPVGVANLVSSSVEGFVTGTLKTGVGSGLTIASQQNMNPAALAEVAAISSASFSTSPDKVSGTLQQDGNLPASQTFSFTRQTLASQPLATINTTYTGVLSSDLDGVETGAQIVVTGTSFSGTSPAGCVFNGTLTDTAVNSVYTVLLAANDITASRDCMGDRTQVRTGVAVLYAGKLYMAVADPSRVTAAIFSGS